MLFLYLCGSYVRTRVACNALAPRFKWHLCGACNAGYASEFVCVFKPVANAFVFPRLFLKPRPTMFPCPFLLLVHVSIACPATRSTTFPRPCPTTRPTTFPSLLASTSPHLAHAFKLASILKDVHMPNYESVPNHVPEQFFEPLPKCPFLYCIERWCVYLCIHTNCNFFISE